MLSTASIKAMAIHPGTIRPLYHVTRTKQTLARQRTLYVYSAVNSIRAHNPSLIGVNLLCNFETIDVSKVCNPVT